MIAAGAVSQKTRNELAATVGALCARLVPDEASAEQWLQELITDESTVMAEARDLTVIWRDFSEFALSGQQAQAATRLQHVLAENK